MTLYYLDASAWVKRYYYEALGTAWVRGLFESNQSMACATLGLVEVTATLARKQREMKISAPGMMRLLGQLSSDWENFWQVDLDRRVVNAAASFARDFKLRGADALHLAAADLLWQRLKDTPDRIVLVTADREMRDAARKRSMTVIDPNRESGR